jgi:hypothetical protein
MAASTTHEEEPLNEVSRMTELKAMRMLLSDKQEIGDN